jgi:hypothetical protein
MSSSSPAPRKFCQPLDTLIGWYRSEREGGLYHHFQIRIIDECDNRCDASGDESRNWRRAA